MSEPGRDAASQWRLRLLVALALLAGANLVVLVVRVVSLRRSALCLQLPNAEGVNLYALWRLCMGHVL